MTAVDEKGRDLSLKHFLKEMFVAVTDVDSALIGSSAGSSFDRAASRPSISKAIGAGSSRRFAFSFYATFSTSSSSRSSASAC